MQIIKRKIKDTILLSDIFNDKNHIARKTQMNIGKMELIVLYYAF